MLTDFCNRYGTVHSMKELAPGQTLVMYTTKESAVSAYKEISVNAIGEPPITAEFLTEGDLAAIVNANNAAAAAAVPAPVSAELPMSNLWPSSSTSLSEQSNQWNGPSNLGGSSIFSSTSSAWSSGGGHIDDHSVLSGDLLGGQ